MNNLIFLKLGGSLITEKNKTATARPEVLARIASEIAGARAANPEMQLLLGHGSGSFGHVPAKKYNTRAGVHGLAQWSGFAEVKQQAAALDNLVASALRASGLQPIIFAPSATVKTGDRQIISWNIEPIKSALKEHLLPLTYGDVVYDEKLGGTILSTEDLFVFLAEKLQPKLLLLAGDEEGVYRDYPARTQVIAEISRRTYPEIAAAVGGAAAADVTGGMAGKVQAMLQLIEQLPQCQVRIFSGLEPGNVQAAIGGAPLGTLLRAD